MKYYNKYSQSIIIYYSGPESSSNTTHCTVNTCTTPISSQTQSGNLYIYMCVIQYIIYNVYCISIKFHLINIVDSQM